jgi:uroporphyrinogen-III decarboxylase
VLASQGLSNTADGVATLTVRLGADLSFLSCSGPQAVADEAGALRASVDAVHARGLACGAVVNGPWQRLTEANGLETALRQLATDSDTEQQIAALATRVQLEAGAWEDAGADLIMLADDLAYNGGPYFSPTLFRRLLVPHYRRLLLAARRLPIGFHSDGDLSRLLPALVSAGFACFSLEPEATSPSAVWQRFGHHVTLLSGIPAAWLTTPVAAANVQAELQDLVRGGSLILTSACGLFEPSSVDRLKTIYHLARRSQSAVSDQASSG